MKHINVDDYTYKMRKFQLELKLLTIHNITVNTPPDDPAIMDDEQIRHYFQTTLGDIDVELL